MLGLLQGLPFKEVVQLQYENSKWQFSILPKLYNDMHVHILYVWASLQRNMSMFLHKNRQLMQILFIHYPFLILIVRKNKNI